MTKQDWATFGAPTSSFFEPTSYFGASGFDFGMSQPKAGLGYGLLGDTRSLKQGQTCTNCPPSDPCPNCGEPSGQIIKVQAPMPMPVPGMGPPPIGLLPQKPHGNVVIGDPNAWWNWTPGEVGDWARGIFESRGPSKAVEKKCDEQLDAEYRRCDALARKATAEAGPERGSRERISCRENAGMRHAECRVNKGTPKTPLYPDWPYPDDFDNPYPG